MSDEVNVQAGEPAAQEPQGGGSTALNSLIKEDGSFGDGFFEALPEGLGSHSALTKYKSVGDLAKGYVNAQALIGRKTEEFWKSDDPEIVSKRREIMGIPNDPDGYEFQLPEIPEEIAGNYEDLSEYKAKAAELGLTKAQAQALLEWDAQRGAKAFDGIGQQMEAQKQEAAETLQKEWGRSFDENLSKVKRATDYLGITDVLNETGLGNEPLVLKAVLERIVPAITDDKLVEGTTRQTLETIHDQMRDLDTRMLSYAGQTTDAAYRAMVAEKEKILSKLA